MNLVNSKKLSFGKEFIQNCYKLTGDCDGDNFDIPRCVNCTASVGLACEQDCIHGHEDPNFPTVCVCDACYDDIACSVECNNRGVCTNESGTTVSLHFLATIQWNPLLENFDRTLALLFPIICL